jgi:hypothetical protein
MQTALKNKMMTIKFGRHIFFILSILCISCTAFAQGGRMRVLRRDPVYRPDLNRQQNLPKIKPIQQIKEEFISKQLALPPEQTLRFEAVYRRYLQETGAVRVLKRINNSDAQANGTEQVNKDLDYERQLLDIRQRYTNEFLKIMPPEKVSIIFKSERQFNDEAVKILKEKKANGQAQPPAK